VEVETMAPIAVPLTRFKWPVAASRTIAAPASKIWEVISSPGSLTLYHPFCEKNIVFDWPGSESHDEIHYFNGVVLVRRFTDWYEDVGYDLEIGRDGGRTSVASWRISPIDEQRSSIAITIYPHAFQRLPIVVRWMPHLFWLRPQLERYLTSVVDGLHHFVTRGEKVQRNQFGAHPWFSPPTKAGGIDDS
jgi:hypothetical protein